MPEVSESGLNSDVRAGTCERARFQRFIEEVCGMTREIKGTSASIKSAGTAPYQGSIPSLSLLVSEGKGEGIGTTPIAAMLNGERPSQEQRLIVRRVEVMISEQGHGAEGSEGAATPFPMTVPETVPPDAEFEHVSMNAKAQEHAALPGAPQRGIYQTAQDLPKKGEIGCDHDGQVRDGYDDRGGAILTG
jgi:hypothetical protein